MRNHPGDDALLDVVEGNASVEAERHVAGCAECARRVTDVRSGLAMATGAEAPEPSPLFFHHFRGRVASALEAPPARPRYAGFFLPALLATAATVAVIAYLPGSASGPIPSPAPSTWSSLPAEPALEAYPATVLAEEVVGCRDVADCVADLSDEESRAFADALRAELAARESL